MRKALKKKLTSGTTAERLQMLERRFAEHNVANETPSLTPAEFGKFTYSLGIELTKEELEEIIIAQDHPHVHRSVV